MTTGLTFGAFDIIHEGHIALLTRASQLCDELIVCVSSDEYIEIRKGHLPTVPLCSRRIVLMSLHMIDGVDIQTLEFGKKEAVEKYKPDLLIVGDDWTPETYGGEGLGVPVVYLPYTDLISSTILREKM